MEFIADQFRASNPNYEGLGVFLVAKAKDRSAAIQSNGDTYCLTVHKYGTERQSIFMTEKMFIMVKALFAHYDPGNDQEGALLHINEKCFDGAFRVPGAVT